ncbi:MAG: hypothetical protein OZ921_21810 [Sorangiineae bacterium]|nr:hypothetical protein [Polyangiaceae bacterium]MEB2325165.1 hypothetical protein [Sorangiineae bacterium]
MAATSEVKGVYFVSARDALVERAEPGALARVTAALPEATRRVFEEPLTSGWYPEVALHDLVTAIWSEICDRDRERFLEFLEFALTLGMKRFFRALLGVTSPGFFLRRYPTVFSAIRRGPPHVTVEVERTSATIHVHDMPYSDDPLYHLVYEAGFNVFFLLMKRTRPRMRLMGASATALTILLDWDERR